MNKTYITLPTLITISVIALSWCALVLLVAGLPHWAIVTATVAFVFDGIDGWAARYFRQESSLGRILDSIGDFLNYSLFAALLTYLYIIPGVWGVFVGMIIVVTGAYRLARFTVEGFLREKTHLYYEGLIVCYLSLTAVLLYFAHSYYPYITSYVSGPLLIGASLLQVTRIKIRKTGLIVWVLIAGIVAIIALKLEYGN